MKILLQIILLLAIASCAEFKNNIGENKSLVQQTSKTKKISSKKLPEPKKDNTRQNITGTLASGVEYEVIAGSEGFTISFIPFIAKNDQIFLSATTQIIAKLYNDKINGESNISVESNIDYTIFKGEKARYRIVPSKESNDEISSMTITLIPLS